MSAAVKARPASREEALAGLAAAFRGAMAAVRRLRGRDTQRPGELSFAQYHLLFGLHQHDELSTGELAETAEVTPATVTQMLDSLVEMGLVERHRSDRDRRVVTCALTPRGRELITERRARLEERWRVMLTQFSAAELTTAAAVITELRTFYDELLEESANTPARIHAGTRVVDT